MCSTWTSGLFQVQGDRAAPAEIDMAPSELAIRRPSRENASAASATGMPPSVP